MEFDACPAGTKQFVPQTTEFVLNQPLQNPFGIIWLTQLQSKFSIMDPKLIDFDLEFFQEHCRHRDPSAAFYSSRIYFTKSSRIFTGLIFSGTAV